MSHVWEEKYMPVEYELSFMEYQRDWEGGKISIHQRSGEKRKNFIYGIDRNKAPESVPKQN